MDTILISSQEEWDKLPDSFDTHTIIKIENTKSQIIVKYKLNATVRAGDNATVEAWGNATVRAGDNATVRAWDNATVRAWGNAILRVLSRDAIIRELADQAIAVIQGCEGVVVSKKDDTAQVIYTKQTSYTLKSIQRLYNQPENGPIVLYKSVQDDFTDFHTGKIKYDGIVECPDWDPNPDRECGGGLHLSPTPGFALDYNTGKLLRCEVMPEDISVYPYNITKVRCRKVKVIGPCDRKGSLLSEGAQT
jgi:hypothetical protein